MTIKKFIRRNIAEGYVLSAFITILNMQIAYELRGYFALGGEILIPLILVMLHIWTTMEE